MGLVDNRINGSIRVRFAHVDGARVIFYPRYFEIAAEVFPDVVRDVADFDVLTQFRKPNVLSDDVQMTCNVGNDGWRISGGLVDEHFSIELRRRDAGLALQGPSTPADVFRAPSFAVMNHQCGADGLLQLSRYYELVSNTIEQWFESSLGMLFSDVHDDWTRGMPTVELKTSCLVLPAERDEIAMWVQPKSVGSSAMQFTSFLVRSGEVLARTDQVVVFVGFRDGRIAKTALPETLRATLRRRLAGTSDE